MPNVEITQSGDPQSEEDIKAVEAKISRAVPATYRKFLLDHNGGHPEPADFHFADSKEDGGIVAAFFGVNVSGAMNLEDTLRTYADRIPTRMFPIAHDPGGNLILLVVSGKDKNKIYFWDHEEEAEEGEPPTEDNLTLISNSFTAFLNSLDNLW